MGHIKEKDKYASKATTLLPCFIFIVQIKDKEGALVYVEVLSQTEPTKHLLSSTASF